MKKYCVISILLLLVTVPNMSVYKIDGQSMIPALFPNDYVLVLNKNRFTTFMGLYELKIDDIILFYFQDSKGKNIYIKRCIGLKDDLNSIIKERLSFKINKFKYYSDTFETDLKNKMDMSLTQGYYVIGDNLIMSIDSRIFGKIKEENIFGKVILNIKLF